MVLVTRFVGSEPLLLVESGSSVAASARATLSREPVVGAVTVTVRERLSPLARLGTAGQVTTPAARVPPLLAETKVTPAGRVSWTLTVAGPVLASFRSASSWTAVETRLPGSDPLLLVESGSSVAASARATLSSVPVVGAMTVTVRDRLAPLARLGTDGQITTPAARLPPLLAESNMTPAGSV